MPHGSEASTGSKATCISAVWRLVDECSNTSWDGYGARSISAETGGRAENFILTLPDGVPVPELSPEPDGSISLDWIESPDRILSLSVGTTDRLAYAWVNGTDRGHAVDQFDGDRTPARIIEGIRAVTSRGHAAIGTS